jgi:hypothetical protein
MVAGMQEESVTLTRVTLGNPGVLRAVAWSARGLALCCVPIALTGVASRCRSGARSDRRLGSRDVHL